MTSSFAHTGNVEVLESTYSKWKTDPLSVDRAWSAFFEGFELGCAMSASSAPKSDSGATGEVPLQTRVDGLVFAYRMLGHSIATIDPLAKSRPENPLLSLRELGFSEKDMDLMVSSKFYMGGQRMKLREMIDSFRSTYAGNIGYEFMHIQNARVRNWVREKIESRAEQDRPTPAAQIAILRTLLEAEMFEHFLHTKYLGQKRFSLEGGESLMVALEIALGQCPRHEIQEIVMGMAHRGRLTVLATFLKKSLNVLFSEFSENYMPDMVGGDGDVKYHLGYASKRVLDGNYEVAIRLSPNPSHLEAVNPVVEGLARARQRIRKDTEQRSRVLPLLIHGDAAFAGQGIVAETLNLSQLPGYKTGGTLHIIVNNQIGFTTLPADARSSSYCTDVAKMIEAPVFHVNGDDPVSVAYVTRLALEFRQQFHRDVVIDIYCYRRHGHNEGDEPAYTQPDLYSLIATHPSTATVFKRQLVAKGILTDAEAASLDDEFERLLDRSLRDVKEAEKEKQLNRFAESTAEFQPPYSHNPVDTSIPQSRLEAVVRAITRVPESFNVLPKVKRLLLEKRMQVFHNGGPYDWAYAEHLAFGSLLLEGVPVRLSGQDSGRGTFSQRHAVLYDAKTREKYIPLQHLSEGQARFCVYNSLLSEAAVLGFDYGYSLGFPEMLCMWEAQFGDFANGAQVIIDQFITTAESKWQRVSGIVMLLPHGYDGQGPEHSSARIERFLTLAADENIQVCNVTTPAQYFHLLRRQMKRSFRKPLVIFTPKSLLRHEACVSSAGEFTSGRFHEVLPGENPGDPDKVKRVIFCSGKVYYDLLKYRADNRIATAAIVRIEQLYPLHEDAVYQAAKAFKNASRFVWCQEEPKNMGSATYIRPMLRRILERDCAYAGRSASSSPAVGVKAYHVLEQDSLLEKAFSV